MRERGSARVFGASLLAEKGPADIRDGKKQPYGMWRCESGWQAGRRMMFVRRFPYVNPKGRSLAKNREHPIGHVRMGAGR